MPINQWHRCHGDGMPVQFDTGQAGGHASRRRCWEVDQFKVSDNWTVSDTGGAAAAAKKNGGLGKNDEAYDIHEKLVAGLESENRLSRRVDSLLHRKFGRLAADLFGHRRSMQSEIDAHRQKCLRLENKLVAVRETKANLQQTLAEGDHRQRLAALALENQKLREEYASVDKRLENALCQVAAFQEQNRCLNLQLEEQCGLNSCIEEQTQLIIGEMAGWNRCDAGCPAFDLGWKRVQFVGGITRMESLYRELVESRGGIFEYHDGYVRKGARSLEGCFKRADMVLCPVSRTATPSVR